MRARERIGLPTRMATPTPPAPSDEATFLRNPPWWILLLIGASGGGGIGTLLSRPVYASGESITREDVQEVVDASIVKNNEVLLQKIELMVAKDRLHAAGLSSPAFAESTQP